MTGKDANMADVYQVFPLIQEAEVSFEFNSINNDPCLSRKRWVQGYIYTAMEKLYQLVHEGSLTETEAYCILSGGRGQILPYLRELENEQVIKDLFDAEGTDEVH